VATTWRVLVTGSRIWEDPVPVIAALNLTWVTAVAERGGHLFVMEGDCPTGADRWARVWCRQAGFPGVRHQSRPAQWTVHDDRCGRPGSPCKDPAGRSCRNAGFRRNGEMVEQMRAGAQWAAQTLVLAFVRDGSSGATQCAAAADRAGLSVVRFSWEVWRQDLAEFAATLQSLDAQPDQR
jgi:hypothetical protein